MSQSLSEYRIIRKFRMRVYQFVGFIFITSLFLFGQLLNLQLVNGYENRILAKKFVSRQEFTVAPRGLIFDRNVDEDATPLVKNINYIDFVIYPSRFRNREEGKKFLQSFALVMGHPFKNYSHIISPTKWKSLVSKNESVVLLTRMTRREHERLAGFQMISRYGEFITNHLRYYTMGPALAHVSGYIGLPSRKELNKYDIQPYQMIGKAGVESVYDEDLRGTDGIRIRNRIIDTEEQISRSIQGNNLVLTIDRDVQATAYQAIVNSGLRGTAIAINANNGEILALVSNPTYDPNILSSGDSEQINRHYKKVLKYKGFLNIAIQTKFPPASTFKPLVATAALETYDRDTVNPDEKILSPGSWTLKSTLPGVPDAVYYCWKKSGHGYVNMVEALANSANVYFYKLGYKIGPTPIIHYARAFGLDQLTGIDLPGEITGFVPDKRWKQITWSSRWYDGDTINLSIGQGFLEVTPIEMAVMYSAIINGGRIYKPHVIKEVRDPSTGRLLRKYEPELVKEIPLKEENLNVVREGMRSVVTIGTARRLSSKIYPPIAGKTGTVQTRSTRHGRDHAWFIGYAPYNDPTHDPILVAVFLQYGMGGAKAAAPVAGEIFKTIFPDYKSKN